jgi:hypothetical protein
MEKKYPIEYIGGRKFLGFILLTIIGTLLVYSGHLDGTIFWGFATAAWGIFAHENVEAKKIPPAITPTV